MGLQSFNDSVLPKKVERSCLGPRTTGAYFIFSYRSEKDHFLKCINIIKPRYFNKLPYFWWNFQHFGGPLADPLDLAAPLKSFADHLGVRGPQVENHCCACFLDLSELNCSYMHSSSQQKVGDLHCATLHHTFKRYAGAIFDYDQCVSRVYCFCRYIYIVQCYVFRKYILKFSACQWCSPRGQVCEVLGLDRVVLGSPRSWILRCPRLEDSLFLKVQLCDCFHKTQAVLRKMIQITMSIGVASFM